MTKLFYCVLVCFVTLLVERQHLINGASVIYNADNTQNAHQLAAVETSNNNNNNRVMSDHWIMKMSVDDIDMARKIASEHNFRVIRRIGSFDGYFMIKPDEHRTKYKRSTNNDSSASDSPVANGGSDPSLLVSKFEAHPLIESIHQEEILNRTKRDFIDLPVNPAISHVLLNNDFVRQQR